MYMSNTTMHRLAVLLNSDDMGKLKAMASKDERSHTGTIRMLIREAFAARAAAVGRPVADRH